MQGKGAEILIDTSFIAKLPQRPAIYALLGSGGRSADVAYVGISSNLRDRLTQHFVRRDSSITTGSSVVSLNPDLVTVVRWWEHERFDDKAALGAAELVAFEALNPTLRSRGLPSDKAKQLYQDEQFHQEMWTLFSGQATGEEIVTTLRTTIKRLSALEQRVDELEQHILVNRQQG